MLSIITALLSGPVIGLVGKFLTSWMGQREKKLDLQELDLKQNHELKLHELNQKAKQEEYQNEQYLVEVQTAADTLKASYKHDTEYGTLPSKWVPFFRAIRPVLTVAPFIALMFIFYTVGMEQFHINGLSIQEKITVSMITMFEIAFTWWFADRQMSKGVKN